MGANLSSPRVHIVAANGSLSESPFLRKLGLVLNSMSGDISFWGWDRGLAQVEDREMGYRRFILHRSSKEARFWLGVSYLKWMAKCLSVYWSRRGREDLFLCSRFEAALPAAVVSLIGEVRFVFLNRDNVSLSYRWPKWIKNLIAKMERFVAKRSLCHIVPGPTRWSRIEANLRVVPNTPHSLVLAEASCLAESLKKNLDGRLVVYVNGWLSSGRGMEMILRAWKQMDRRGSRLIVAGMVACKPAETLVEREDVEFLGYISNVESVAWNYIADVVLAFYDPSIEINRVAEPNKWWDCVATGTAFVTNEGLLTAEEFIKNERCFVVDYGDAVALARLLETLALRRELVREKAEALGREGFSPWDTAMGRVLSELLATS